MAPDDDRDLIDENDPGLIQPRSAPPGGATRDNVRDDAEDLGERSGGFLGGVSGAALGAMAGPVGIVLGGLAGMVGGWWAGRGIANAITSDDDTYYRTQYERSPARLADRSYEHVRPAYVIGHLAGRNPEYGGRSFDDVEPDLQRAWSDEVSAGHGRWPAVRSYARLAFDRARAVGSGD